MSELQNYKKKSGLPSVMQKVCSSHFIKKTLINMNPQPPKLRSQFKEHKLNHTIRPVSNRLNTAYHDLARFLHETLKKSFIFQNSSSVPNSHILVYKVKDLDCSPDTKLFFTGYKKKKKMYTSVLTLELLKIVEENLCQFKNLSSEHIIDFMNLINVVVTTTVNLTENCTRKTMVLL